MISPTLNSAGKDLNCMLEIAHGVCVLVKRLPITGVSGPPSPAWTCSEVFQWVKAL